MNTVLERTGGFAAVIGRLARDSARGVYRDMQDRAAEKRGKRDLEQIAAENAVAKVKVLAQPVIDSYRPAIRQAEIDAVSWKTPVAVEDLLGAECDRIRAQIEPLLYEAGFPLGSKDQAVRETMQEAFHDLLRELHAKAFAGLRLPPFFAMRNGFIEFEPTYKSDTKAFFYPPYVGAVSGYRYIDDRYASERPTFGFV